MIFFGERGRVFKRLCLFAFVVGVFFCTVPVLAQPPIDPEKLVADLDRLARGITSFGRYEMVVSTPRWQRTVGMEAWSAGNDRSFVKITSPRKDQGITFLRVGNQMWQFVPKIEKIVKIPPSMMLQSWMGSDLTNDDLVKESSLVDDYDKKVVGVAGDLVTLELRPRPLAPVVWGRVLLEVDRGKMVLTTARYYDEDDLFIRQVSYLDVKRLKDRFYPMTLEVKPMLAEDEGRSTVLLVKEIVLDESLPEKIFTLRALKSMAR